jgi:SAM-dependent MidA family methyltransferase
MFGELLGLWAAQVWLDQGRPSPVRLVELGPGRGTLMADVLRAMRSVPGLWPALDVHLVETSPTLRAKQRESLKNFASSGIPITWHERLEDVPKGPLLLLANEFFDALPIRQFVRSGGAWRERLVGLGADGKFAFGLAPESSPELAISGPEGAVFELCPAGLVLAGEIAARIARSGGAAPIVDYGHTASGFGDTFQAVRNHAFADPLAEPGQADLTAHVDFAALAASARQAGATVEGPVEQGEFLRALGLEARAERLAANRPDQVETVRIAALRLAGQADGQMGHLFKVMAIRPENAPPTPGPWLAAAR